MTIAELISRLQEMADAHGEDAEVRLMTQENYPLQAHIHGVTSTADMDGQGECENCGRATWACECGHADDSEATPAVVYVVEGDQIGYGRKAAWS